MACTEIDLWKKGRKIITIIVCFFLDRANGTHTRKNVVGEKKTLEKERDEKHQWGLYFLVAKAHGNRHLPCTKHMEDD